MKESNGPSSCNTSGGNENMVGSSFGPYEWSLIYGDLGFLTGIVFKKLDLQIERTNSSQSLYS